MMTRQQRTTAGKQGKQKQKQGKLNQHEKGIHHSAWQPNLPQLENTMHFVTGMSLSFQDAKSDQIVELQ